MKKIDLNPDLGNYRADRKSLEIIRMSCLKSASELLHGLPMDLDQKTGMAVEIAKEFEKYVRGNKDKDDFAERLGDIIKDTSTSCYASALMSNHVHLLLRVIGDCMGVRSCIITFHMPDRGMPLCAIKTINIDQH